MIFFFFFFTALRSHGAAYVVDSRVVGLGVGKIRNVGVLHHAVRGPTYCLCDLLPLLRHCDAREGVDVDHCYC